jgi:uncharacterized membrane protein YdcZ (DUF606 family)
MWAMIIIALICGMCVPWAAKFALKLVQRIYSNDGETYWNFATSFLCLVVFSAVLVLLSRNGGNPALMVIAFIVGIGIGRLTIKDYK